MRSPTLFLHFLPSQARNRVRSIRGFSRGFNPARFRTLSLIARRTGPRRMAAENGPQGPSLSPAMENSLVTGENSHETDPSPAGIGIAATPSPAGIAAIPSPVVVAGAAGRGAQRDDVEWFRVSESVKLALHRGDITKWSVDRTTDAIVNAANSRMLGGGGVDGAIHRKAGPNLREACKEVPEVSRNVRCPVGEARLTPGFDLPVSRVIHTVGPVYWEYDDPARLLGNAYRNSLKVAIENGIKYIAFPAISCGVYRYPPGEAAKVSLSVIKVASNGLSEVHFVFFERETFSAWMERASNEFEKVEVPVQDLPA